MFLLLRLLCREHFFYIQRGETCSPSLALRIKQEKPDVEGEKKVLSLSKGESLDLITVSKIRPDSGYTDVLSFIKSSCF